MIARKLKIHSNSVGHKKINMIIWTQTHTNSSFKFVPLSTDQGQVEIDDSNAENCTRG